MMELSRHPTTYPTRYQQIAAQLEQELRTQYRCGDYLPSEQQLAERYQVNRHTLRRAGASGWIFCWNIFAIGRRAIDDCSACARSSVFLVLHQKNRANIYI